jgi:hypothetical protein
MSAVVVLVSVVVWHDVVDVAALAFGFWLLAFGWPRSRPWLTNVGIGTMP